MEENSETKDSFCEDSASYLSGLAKYDSSQGDPMYQPGKLSDEEFVESKVCLGERKLLANILQRAILDALSLYERETIGGEECEVVMLINCTETAKRKRVEKNKNSFSCGIPRIERHAAIQWIKKGDIGLISFDFVIRSLNLEGYRDKIIYIIDNDTLEDRPGLAKPL